MGSRCEAMKERGLETPCELREVFCRYGVVVCFFFSSRRRHTRLQGDWSSDVCSSDLSFTEAKTSGQSLRMRVVDPLHEPAWDDVAALHRDAGCFHTSAWARVLHQT